MKISVLKLLGFLKLLREKWSIFSDLRRTACQKMIRFFKLSTLSGKVYFIVTKLQVFALYFFVTIARFIAMHPNFF
jgi:hypothetical protein